MRKTGITESDIAAVAAKLEQIAPDIYATVTEGPEWSNPPAVKIIDCVLSLKRNYDKFLTPRLKAFINNHPDTQRVVELVNLMDSYPTPHAFMQQELNYNYEDCAKTLQSVARYICSIVEGTPIASEEETLKQWAIQAKPQDYQTLNIKGFGLAGFQYLRMLFGAQTSKPDRHIKKFVSNILGRNVSDSKSLFLLEAASARIGLSVRAVDRFIWNRGARGTGTNEVIRQERKIVGNTAGSESSSKYSEFWEPIRREGLFAGKPVPINELQIRKNVHGVQLFLALSNHRCYIKLSFEGQDKSERRGEIMELFPESEYDYEYRESSKFASVVFPVIDKGRKDRDDWPEIQEKLVSMGTDIYNKINESDT